MNFSLSFSTVFPLCVYLLMGILAGKAKLVSPGLSSQVNAFVFKLLFPLLMFQNMLSAKAALGGEGLYLGLYLLGVILVVFFLLWLLVPRFVKERGRQASFIQGAFRGNSVLFALPVVATLCGQENTGLASMCLVILIPAYNILSVILLELMRGGSVDTRSILLSILRNPLIIGAIAGTLFLLTGWELPSLVKTPLSALTGIITPLCLMMLGAQLRFQGIRKDIGQLLVVSFIKLILIPAAAFLPAGVLGFSPLALVTALAMTAVPTAVASFPMAEQMGADGPFAGEVVAMTTVASMVTVFCWVLLLSGLGLAG